MSTHPDPQDITAAERSFLAALKNQFAPEGGELTGIHKKVYEATEKLLAEKGEATLEEIMKTGRTALSEMYATAMHEAAEGVIAANTALFNKRTPANMDALDTAIMAHERVEVLAHRDKQDMMSQQTLALAEAEGLTSGISKAEKNFLEGVNAFIDKDGGPSTYQEELYTALYEEVAKRGESTRQDLAGVIETMKSNDMEERKKIEKQFNQKANEVDYDNEMPLPRFQKIMDKAGIAKVGRE